MNKEAIIERQANENLKLVNDNYDLQQRIDKAIEYILKEYDTYDKGIFIVDQYDQPIYVDEIYGTLLSILKGSEDNE